MMKIVQDGDNFSLYWSYAIKNMKSVKNGKDYYTQVAVMPSELVDYLNNPSYIFLYQQDSRVLISTKELVESEAVRVKLLSKTDKQVAKDITLSKKVFSDLRGCVNGIVQYILHTSEQNPDGTMGTVEIKLLTEQE